MVRLLHTIHIMKFGWADEAKEFIRHWKGEVQPDNCICPSHLKEAQHKYSLGFTPKWSEFLHHLQQSKVCVFLNCNASRKLIAPAFAPTEELQAKLNNSGEVESLQVCQKHYNQLYWEFHCSLRPCAICGIRPKHGIKFARHCPNLDFIKQLLDGESISSNIAFV